MSQTKKRSWFGLFKGAFFASLFAAVGAGGYWYYTDNIVSAAQASPSEQPIEPSRAKSTGAQRMRSEAPIYVALEPFTVTLQNGDRPRVLHIGFTLQVDDENSKARIEQSMPELRGRILMTLADVDPVAIRDRHTRTQLLHEVSRLAAQPFGQNAQEQHVNNVFLTTFVIQ